MKNKNLIHTYEDFMQETSTSADNAIKVFEDFIENKKKSLEDKLSKSQERIKISTEKAKESAKKASNFKEKMANTKDPIAKKIYGNRASEEQMKAQIYAEKTKLHQMNTKLAQSELGTTDLKQMKKETPPKI